MKRRTPERKPAIPGWRGKLVIVLLLAALTGGGVFWALQTFVGPRVVVLPDVRRLDVGGSTASTQPATTRAADTPAGSLRP